MATIVPVEDMVKTALKEAMAKRKLVEGEAGDETPPVFLGEEKPVEITPPVVVAKHPPVSEIMAKEGRMWAGKLVPQLGGVNNFAVRVFKPEDWSETIRAFIPTVEPEYVINPVYARNILKSWELGEKILIHGPTGSGKDSLVEQLCALTNRPFVRINATGDMDSSMMFGQQTASEGSTHWVDGPITEAVKLGAVVVWDEWDVTPAEITMGLQWLLEKRGRLFLKEKPGSALDKFIVPHSDFRIVAIGNTQGQGDVFGAHNGTNVQNTATLDRFDTAIHMTYMSEANECLMLGRKYPSRNSDDNKKLVQLGALIRQGYSAGQLGLTMSPRGLLNICQKQLNGYSFKESLQLTYLNKLVESQQKVVLECVRKIYGSAA